MEGIAFSLLIKGIDGCTIESTADHVRGELAGLRRGERSQLDLLKAAFSSERLQQRTDARLIVQLFNARGRAYDHRNVRMPADEEAQELERGLVAPLQILQHQEQGVAGGDQRVSQCFE